MPLIPFKIMEAEKPELKEALDKIKKLEQEALQKDAIIKELQAEVSSKDGSSLSVNLVPTLKHNGVTYEVHARTFILKGEEKEYTLKDLEDPKLVAKLVEIKAGFLVPVPKK